MITEQQGKLLRTLWPAHDTAPDFLSPMAVTALIGKSRRTLINDRRKGSPSGLKHVKIGSRIKYPKAALARWLVAESTFIPIEVELQKLEKEGMPPTLRVMYWNGKRGVSEFVRFLPGQAVHRWWTTRFAMKIPDTVDDAMSDMTLPAAILDVTESLTIRKKGRYYNVIGAQLKTRVEATVGQPGTPSQSK
jgi:hypothetical protein